MKLIFFIVIAGTLALFSGCATIVETQVPTAAPGGDGTIHQIKEFKDLTIPEQEVILHGG